MYKNKNKNIFDIKFQLQLNQSSNVLYLRKFIENFGKVGQLNLQD
jgi:hypothetical protein